MSTERRSNLPEGQGFPEAPGEWAVRRTKDGDERYNMFWFTCPREAGKVCAVPLLPRRLPNGAGWSWDPDTKSLTPSVNCVGGCGWHGFVTNGEIR